jgi:NADPH-dependent curcumin reductase CurA
MAQGIQKSLSINGFQVLDLLVQYGRPPFIEEYLPLLRDKMLKWKEHKTYGLENLAEAFVGLLKGQNDGKAIIVVAED